MKTEIRTAQLVEREAVEALARTFPLWSDNVIAATWRRWKNWDDFPPLIALRVSESGASLESLVGFHFFTVNKRYLNCYYIGVDPAYRGQRLAQNLIEAALLKAYPLKTERFKFKCRKDNPEGLGFWDWMGARAVAQTENEWVFDQSMLGAASIDALRKRWATDRPEFVPTDSMRRYEKYGTLCV